MKFCSGAVAHGASDRLNSSCQASYDGLKNHPLLLCFPPGASLLLLFAARFHHESLVAGSRSCGRGSHSLLSVPDGSGSRPAAPAQELPDACEREGEACGSARVRVLGCSALLNVVLCSPRKAPESRARSRRTARCSWRAATRPGSTPPCRPCAATTRCSPLRLPWAAGLLCWGSFYLEKACKL